MVGEYHNPSQKRKISIFPTYQKIDSDILVEISYISLTYFYLITLPTVYTPISLLRNSTQMNKSRPVRKQVQPKRFKDETYLKGSGQAGQVNGIDFDQYDRRYNSETYGEQKTAFDLACEEYENLEMAKMVKKVEEINKSSFPDLVKDNLKKQVFGDTERLRDAEFIAPEGEVLQRVAEEEEEEEWVSGDETDEEEMIFELEDD